MRHAFASPAPGYGDQDMNTPSAKHGSSAPPAARTQSAPATSNKVATEIDVAYIDGVAYPINKNETMLSFMRRPLDMDLNG